MSTKPLIPDQQAHALFLPLLAPGHMMPMVEIARLFAANGVRVTIITTPRNALRFKHTIDRDVKSGCHITFEILTFPSIQVGLPEDIEDFSSAYTTDMTLKLIQAIEMLEPQMEKLIWQHKPNCIVSDYVFHWTVNVASKLGIPRIAFSGSSFFNLCVVNGLQTYQSFKNVVSDTESFIIPGLPDPIKLTKSQLSDIVTSNNEYSSLFGKISKSERESFGVLVNSFYELEPAYVDHFRNVIGLRAWHVGPVSLFACSADDKAERGEKASISAENCLNWLESKKPNSVLYACFGSQITFSKVQINEIACAIESSGHYFIWVVGKVLGKETKIEIDSQQKHWLPEGFEERTKKNGKGLVIRGWAPQVIILEHPAVGAFMTHCGWNSILEGASAGVLMITWPVFAEQFNNEKVVTQVLKFGVPVGSETWKRWASEESPLVGRDKIKGAIQTVMSNETETVEMRIRVSKLCELANKAVQQGNSSYNDFMSLIEEIKSLKSPKLSEK